MNRTIAVDDELLERARAHLAGDRPREEVADELLDLLRLHGGRSGGQAFRRADAYDGRL